MSGGLENAWGTVRKLASLGNVACEASEYARASRLYEEGLEVGRQVGLKHIILPCMEGLVRVAVAQGKMERAARLCGVAKGDVVVPVRKRRELCSVEEVSEVER